MNVTELARRVRIAPAKLREIMPALGFDIGSRAIKVDPKMAEAMIEKLSDKRVRAQYLGEVSPTTNTTNKRVVLDHEDGKGVELLKKLEIPDKIVVKELAKRMDVAVARLMMELFKNGVMASLNQYIDYETAAIIAEDLGFLPVKSEGEKIEEVTEFDYDKLFRTSDPAAVPRPPVIVVMGHVDHGKTKLLDAIRETNIVAGEAGGITQHIGAYQVEKDGRLLTFIDTPGHEAFSAMRSRGARVADIAILLVAADDGVQPQTVEAVAHIKNADLPFIVAINKIDKPEANIEKVKSDLANIGLLPEDWGGKTICVMVSAKQKLNIMELLETLFLVADVNREKIMANLNVPAIGTIVEAHVDKGEGPVATALIHSGILRINDFVEIGGIVHKIRAMKTWKNDAVVEAMPSMPVRLLGLKAVPNVGQILKVITDKKEIKRMARAKSPAQTKMVVDTAPATAGKGGDDAGEKVAKSQVKIILKSDVLGSVEAIIESLQKIKSKTVEIRVLKQGLGNITENDVEQAVNQGALLIGFSVKATNEAKQAAVMKSVTIHIFDVIYDLLALIVKTVKQMAGTEIVRVKVGQVKVLKIFRTNKAGQIIGGRATAGKIVAGSVAVVMRGEQQNIGEVKVAGIEAGHEQVKEVVYDQEFGLRTEGDNIIKEGDELMIFKEEERDAC